MACKKYTSYLTMKGFMAETVHSVVELRQR